MYKNTGCFFWILSSSSQSLQCRISSPTPVFSIFSVLWLLLCGCEVQGQLRGAAGQGSPLVIPARGDMPTEVVASSWGALTSLSICTAWGVLVLL